MNADWTADRLRCDAAGRLDDGTLAYIEAAEISFEDLRAVTAQLAGLMLLAASGARSGGPHHPMLGVAGERLDTARDATLRLSPGSSRTRHHHEHLVATAARLTEALALIRTAPISREGVTGPTRLLNAAWAELGAASRALPGFDLIDLTGACCAMHAPKAFSSEVDTGSREENATRQRVRAVRRFHETMSG